MGTMSGQATAMRPCAFCGKPILAHLQRCPHCREHSPQVRVSARTGSDGNEKIRRGLLYMLLGAVAHYFVAGYSGMKLPLPGILNSTLMVYASELVFLTGLGLFLYGWYLKLRS